MKYEQGHVHVAWHVEVLSLLRFDCLIKVNCKIIFSVFWRQLPIFFHLSVVYISPGFCFCLCSSFHKKSQSLFVIHSQKLLFFTLLLFYILVATGWPVSDDHRQKQTQFLFKVFIYKAEYVQAYLHTHTFKNVSPKSRRSQVTYKHDACDVNSFPTVLVWTVFR